MKNVLADFGTRQLNPDDKIDPVDPDDPLELDGLFPPSATFTPTLIDFPNIEKNDYSTEDFDDQEYLNFESEEKNGVFKIKHRNE